MSDDDQDVNILHPAMRIVIQKHMYLWYKLDDCDLSTAMVV